jgi:hypothetical protein
MPEINKYAPPNSAVADKPSSKSFGFVVFVSVWGAMVLLQSAFMGFYVSFLFQLTRTGAISVLHLLTMMLASALLLVGALALVLKRKASVWLLLSVASGIASLVLGVWYNMITCVALSGLGLLIARSRAGRAGGLAS